MVAEVVKLVFNVALLAKIIVLTVCALVKITKDWFLSTVLAVSTFMSQCRIGLFRLNCLLEFESREDRCSKLMSGLNWTYFGS